MKYWCLSNHHYVDYLKYRVIYPVFFCFLQGWEPLDLSIWLFAIPYLDANANLEPFLKLYIVFILWTQANLCVLEIKYSEWNPIFSQERRFFLPLREVEFSYLLLPTFLMLDFVFLMGVFSFPVPLMFMKGEQLFWFGA